MTSQQCHWFGEPQPGEVLVGIVRGNDLLSRLIKLFSHGIGTHAMFIRGDGNIVENFYPRVRVRGWNEGERRQTEEYRIAGSTPADWLALEHWFARELRRPPTYSIRDLFRFAANKPPLPGQRGFCSMFVLEGIRECLPAGKQPLVRLEYQDYASPAMLRMSPLLIRRRKSAFRLS